MNTDILTPFLNRAGAFDPAEWFQLVPKGTFPIARKEGDKTVIYQQVVDDVSVSKIVAAFTNRRAADANFKLLVDFEHYSHDSNKSSSAACWATELQGRADGVWAKGEWSDEGEAAIRNRRYRYLSPVWFPKQTESLGQNRFRPIEVNDAGLTNKPNLGAALHPFWNRAEDFHGREATTENATKQNMNKIIALLGLAATASEDDIVAKVQAFKNRVAELEPLQGKLTTLETEHTAFKNRYDALLATSVSARLEEFKGVITAESQDAWKNRLTADFDGTTALLKGIKAPATTKSPVHKDGKAVDTTVNTEAFLNRTNEVTRRAQELKDAAPNRPFDNCWQQAQREYDTAHPTA